MYVIKQIILIIAFFLGFYYGIFPLIGFEVLDRFSGWIKININMAIWNIMIALASIWYVNSRYIGYQKNLNSNKLNKDDSTSYKMSTIVAGICFGIFPLLGIRIPSRSGGSLEINSNYAIIIILLSLLALVYLNGKASKQSKE